MDIDVFLFVVLFNKQTKKLPTTYHGHQLDQLITFIDRGR